MLNYQENINNNGPRDSKTNWTNSTALDFWKRGDYEVRVTSYRGSHVEAFYDSLFSTLPYEGPLRWFEFRANQIPFTLDGIGVVNGIGIANSYRNNVPRTFIGYNLSNGHVIDFTTPGCETGEYFHFEFPFF